MDEANTVAAGGGGWSSTRHSRHPAADISVTQLPLTRAWLSEKVPTTFGPLLANRFPALLPDPGSLRVLDAFVVKYEWEAGQVDPEI